MRESPEPRVLLIEDTTALAAAYAMQLSNEGVAVDAHGKVNLAPFSFYNGVSEAPPMVLYCPGGSYGTAPAKHSLLNVQATGEFVVMS